MRFYIHYKTTDAPFGGANSFLKALKSEISKYPDLTVVNNISEKPDVFLYNSFSTGNYRIREKDIKNIALFGYPSYLQLCRAGFRRRKAYMVHRVDGITQMYGREDNGDDDLQLSLNRFADLTIFQSRFCLESFKTYGYSGSNHAVIHNGVDQGLFNTKNKECWDGRRKLKILSCIWSRNRKKGYETIAKLSQLDSVESHFVGNWPKEIDPQRVKLMKPLTQDQLALEYQKHDIFLHPAENDPCSNSVLEALSCGLPVLYKNSGGTPEMVTEKYGVMIDGKELASLFFAISDRYSEWVRNIRNDFAQFSISRAAKEYMDAIKKAINIER
jgi:glycosyltransferase involved in cell wall biosynthesis